MRPPSTSTSGTIAVGDDTPDAVRRARRLGVAFQDASLLPWRSVVGNIKLAFQLVGLTQVLASGVLPPNRSLDCVDDVLADRVRRRDTRPLLRGRDPREVLGDLARVRNPIYAEAHLRISSQSAPHDTTVRAILKAIGK